MNKVILLLLCVSMLGCKPGKDSSSSSGDQVWLWTDPVQCLTNPWESNWLSEGGREYQDYPIGDNLIVEEEEAEIIKGYFLEKEKVTIHDLYSRKYEEVGLSQSVCEACHCPQGYRLFVLVDQDKMKLMEEKGFSEINGEEKR